MTKLCDYTVRLMDCHFMVAWAYEKKEPMAAAIWLLRAEQQ